MANSVEDFLVENVTPANDKKEVKFKRFKSPFIIKGLSAEEQLQLRKDNTRKVLNKKTHKYENEIDQDKLIEDLMAASVVSPNLNSDELQRSWGVIGNPAKLLEKMLTGGEYNHLAEEVNDFNDVDDSQELIEEAKN